MSSDGLAREFQVWPAVEGSNGSWRELGVEMDALAKEHQERQRAAAAIQSLVRAHQTHGASELRAASSLRRLISTQVHNNFSDQRGAADI